MVALWALASVVGYRIDQLAAERRGAAGDPLLA